MTDPAADVAAAHRAFLAGARRATLATIGPDGIPRLVPVCFVVADGPRGGIVVYTPLDEKPKRVADPRSLARVRDLLARPDVVLLVDRWDEDWSRLAWMRAYGTASLLEPAQGDAGAVEDDDAAEHGLAVVSLRAKYPQYADHAIARRPLIRIAVSRVVAWGEPGTPPADGG